MKNVEFESHTWAHSARAPAGWLVVAFLCASCGGARPMRYYTLHMPPPAPTGDPKTNFVLGVEQFRASEPLRDDRILYYESPTQLNFYRQHRWDADPATILSELAQRQLQQTGVFVQVRLAPFVEPVDYLLKGWVLNFEEVDYQGGVKGRVGLELILSRWRDRQVVWAGRRQMEIAVTAPGVAGVVNALNAATKQILDEMIPAIVSQVEDDFHTSKDK